TALGVGFSLVNSGSALLFGYAASCAGQLERAKDAVRLIALITVIGAVMSLILQPPSYYWVSAVVFVPLIGGVNIHFRQVEKANVVLRRAHAEIEHLAAVAE